MGWFERTLVEVGWLKPYLQKPSQEVTTAKQYGRRGQILRASSLMVGTCSTAEELMEDTHGIEVVEGSWLAQTHSKLSSLDKLI